MGRFATIKGLVEAGCVTQLVLSPSGDIDQCAVRSACGGNLTERIEELDAQKAPAIARMLRGCATPDDFKGDDKDMSKLIALKRVETVDGCVFFNSNLRHPPTHSHHTHAVGHLHFHLSHLPFRLAHTDRPTDSMRPSNVV